MEIQPTAAPLIASINVFSASERTALSEFCSALISSQIPAGGAPFAIGITCKILIGGLLLQVDSWKNLSQEFRPYLQQLPHRQCRLWQSYCYAGLDVVLGSGAGLKVFIHQEWLEKTLLSWWLIWDDSPPYQKEKDKAVGAFAVEKSIRPNQS